MRSFCAPFIFHTLSFFFFPLPERRKASPKAFIVVCVPMIIWEVSPLTLGIFVLRNEESMDWWMGSVLRRQEVPFSERCAISAGTESEGRGWDLKLPSGAIWHPTQTLTLTLSKHLHCSQLKLKQAVFNVLVAVMAICTWFIFKWFLKFIKSYVSIFYFQQWDQFACELRI